MKSIKVLLALVFVQATLCLGYLWLERDKATREPSGATFAHAQEDGREVPPLEFTRHDGSRDNLHSLRGRRALVHFWATWCTPCVREVPALLEFARKHQIELLAVSLDSDEKQVERFFDGAVPREVVRASRAAAHELLGVEALPDTYFLNAEGRVVQRLPGSQTWTAPEAEAWFAALPPS